MHSMKPLSWNATRRTGVDKVLQGIQRAVEFGMSVKINAIAMRGFTERQIEAFGAYARTTGIPIRFIEFMPLDSDANWADGQVLSARRL